MKQSQYLQILKLVKSSLEEYVNWGEDEICKMPQASQAQSPLTQASLTQEALPQASQAQASPKQASPTQSFPTRVFSTLDSAPLQSEVSHSSKSQELEELKNRVLNCKDCPLGQTRLNAVFGEGSLSSEIMFVGEGPGFEEDHKGRPFIGKAGQFLTNLIELAGYSRQTVYIANIVKCHPMKDPSDTEKRSNDRPPSD